MKALSRVAAVKGLDAHGMVPLEGGCRAMIRCLPSPAYHKRRLCLQLVGMSSSEAPEKSQAVAFGAGAPNAHCVPVPIWTCGMDLNCRKLSSSNM